MAYLAYAKSVPGVRTYFLVGMASLDSVMPNWYKILNYVHGLIFAANESFDLKSRLLCFETKQVSLHLKFSRTSK